MNTIPPRAFLERYTNIKSGLQKIWHRFASRHVISPGFAVRLFGAGVVAVLASTFAFSFIFSQGVQARSSDVYALGDDFYKTIHERNFVLRSEPNEITSSQQLRDMIYNRFSSMVLEQTTGSMRRYGQQFFGDGFRMRSNIGWDVTEGFRGDLELGVPLLPKSIAGRKFALQFQPGLILWTGHREQERLDINLGLVARYRVGQDSPFAFGMPSLIYGANIFYDLNTDNDLDRLGVGVDMQARRLLLAVNAYIALDDDWQDGDDGYQERAVTGFELRAHYDFLSNAQLRASLGAWENTDVNATGSDFDDYSFGATVGGDWYFHPNFAVSGDYEYEGYGLGDSRFVVGVEARWPGKRLGRNQGTRTMDLYALVEREQRILYAERRSSSVLVTAGMIGQSDIVETDGSTDVDVSFTLEVSRALAAAGAAADGNTAVFDVYTSVAADDIGAGNTAAGSTDYVAIGDPQASGEQTSPAAPVAATGTCAAATPGSTTNPCQLRIVPGTTEGTLTITGLVRGDDVEEEAEYFAVKFKPTAATRARFGLPADFATAVVRILPSDPTRTIELTFQETVALAPATSGGTSPLPVRVTLSKPLAAPVTIDVVLTAQVTVRTQQGPVGQSSVGQQAVRTVERTCRIPVTLESGEEVLVKTVDVSQCFATNQFDITEGEFADATVTLELPPKKLPPRDDDDDEGEGDRESAGEVFDLDGDNKVNGVPLAKEGDAGAGEKQKLKPTGAKVAQAKVALARPAANKRRVAIAVQYADGETSFAEPNSDGTENFRLTLSGTGAVPTGTRVRYEIVHIDTVAADVSVARARTAASAAGATFIALPVTIKADDLAEDAEAFGIKVTEVSEGGSGETIDQTLFTGGSAPGYTATALIAANDRRMVSLASTTLAATETDADIEIDLTARLSGDLEADLVLSLTATPGTAVAADYTVPTSLTIDAGDTSSAAKITIKGDELAEGTETFTIAVRYPSRLPDGLDTAATPNGLIGTVTVTITDDDQPAKLVLYEQVGATAGDTDDRRLGDTASVAEAGNAGNNGKKLYYRLETGADDIATASAALSIALASGAVTVTAPVTVATEPAHFAITPKALTIAQGASLSTVFTITTVDDNGSGADTGPNKNDRRFGLTPSVSNAPGWLTAPTASTITITDDDGKARIEVQAGKVIGGGTAQEATLDLGNVAEGDTLTLSFKLTKAAEGTNVDGISFALAVTDTNSDLGDLSAASVTLTNAANAGPSGAAKTVTLVVTDDARAEGDETFTIAVSSIAATGTSPTLTNFGSGTSTGTASITFTVPASDLATLTFSIASALAEPATTASATAVNMRMESSARLGSDMAFASGELLASTPVSAIVAGSGDDIDSAAGTGSFDGAGANNGRTNIGAVTVQADNLAEGDETFVFQTRLGALIPTNTLGAAFTSANAAGKVAILLKRLGLSAANTHLYKVGSADASATDVAFRIQTSGTNTFLVADITMTIPANDTIAEVGLFDKNPTGTGAQTPLAALELEEAADATDLWVALLDADKKLVRASANVSVTIPAPTVTGGTNEGQLTIATSPVSIPAAAGKAKFTIAAAADGGSNNEDDGSATLRASLGSIPLSLAGEFVDIVNNAEVSVTVNDKEGKRRLTIKATATTQSNIVTSGAATAKAITGNTSGSNDTDYELSVNEAVGAITLTFTLPRAFGGSANIDGITITPGSLDGSSTAAAADFASSTGIPSAAVTINNADNATATLTYTVNDDDLIEGDELAEFPLAITKKSGSSGDLDEDNFATPETINLKITILTSDAGQLQFSFFDGSGSVLDAGYTLKGEYPRAAPSMQIGSGNTSALRPLLMPVTVSVADGTAEQGTGKDYTFTATSGGVVNVSRAASAKTNIITTSKNAIRILEDNVAEGAETFTLRTQIGDTATSGVTLTNTATLANTVAALRSSKALQHLVYYGFGGPLQESLNGGSAYTAVGIRDSGSKLLIATVGGRSQLLYERTFTIPKTDTIAKVGLFTTEPTGTAAQTPITTLTLEEAADATDLWVALLDADNKLVRSSAAVSVTVVSGTVTGGTGEGQLVITTSPVSVPSTAGKAKFTIAAAADSPSNKVNGSATLNAAAGTIPAQEKVDSVTAASVAVTVDDREGKPRLTIAAASEEAGGIVTGATATIIRGSTHAISVKETAEENAVTLTFGLTTPFVAGADITGLTITPSALKTADSSIDAATDLVGTPSTTALSLGNSEGDTATWGFTIAEQDNIAEGQETAVFDLVITKTSGGGTLNASSFGTGTTVTLTVTIVDSDVISKLVLTDTRPGAAGTAITPVSRITLEERQTAATPDDDAFFASDEFYWLAFTDASNRLVLPPVDATGITVRFTAAGTTYATKTPITIAAEDDNSDPENPITAGVYGLGLVAWQDDNTVDDTGTLTVAKAAQLFANPGVIDGDPATDDADDLVTPTIAVTVTDVNAPRKFRVGGTGFSGQGTLTTAQEYDITLAGPRQYYGDKLFYARDKAGNILRDVNGNIVIRTTIRAPKDETDDGKNKENTDTGKNSAVDKTKGGTVEVALERPNSDNTYEVTVSEGVGNLLIPISLDRALLFSEELGFKVRTHTNKAAGLATPLADFIAVDSDIVFEKDTTTPKVTKGTAAALDSQGRIVLSIIDDNMKDGDKTIVLSLSDFEFSSKRKGFLKDDKEDGSHLQINGMTPAVGIDIRVTITDND